MKHNVFGRDTKGPSYEVLHNLCLKINHKLGGITHAFWKRPPIMNRPVMVMIADVTHPPPGGYSVVPSIAAVVGSTDPDVSQFNVEIRLQERVTEEIMKMEEIARSLLLKFFRLTRWKPEQIIYHRDGVSDGQI